ncbi:putative reverse transcriptase domain-containing protein [Tanacetum coccineum]
MTPESVQAMIDQALLRNSINGDGSHRTEGVVGLTRWIEKMESVFNINGCAIENQVRTLGPDAYSMTWELLKKKMTDKYCPHGEVKKLEIELWNLKVKVNDVPTYTEHLQELTLICTKFVDNETEKVDKYINGLPDNIYGNVKSARPKTLDETIELDNLLMDQKLRTYAERQTDNKRKADDSFRNNHGHQQQPFKRQNVAKVYNMGSGEKKPYGGSLPKCTKCHFHHNGPCTQKCHKCNKVGHFARDCKSSGNTNVANTQKGKANPKGNVVLMWTTKDFKRDCPKLKNKDGEMGVHKAGCMPYGNCREEKVNALRDPDSNVVTGTFLLNNCYASILFDIGADRIFISSVFSSLIDIAQTPLENSYDVELADGKIVRISAKKRMTKSKEGTVKELPIVRDFPELFPEDLPGLPQARPVEFHIDLIQDRAPITRSTVSNWHQSEMKELSEQQQRAFRLRLQKNQFIEGFSMIAKPMTKLTQKGIKFNWGEKEENIFQLIKQKCSAPILALPDGSEDFVVFCDASHKGLGVVLMQREKVIAYASP